MNFWVRFKAQNYEFKSIFNCWKNFGFLLLKPMMMSVFLILDSLSTLLSLLMYIYIIKYLYLFIHVPLTSCTNVNNYVIFVPHVPIYWSERINKVES